MSNEYFQPGTVPAQNSFGASAVIRNEYQLVAQGFDKLPPLAGNNLKFVIVNAAGTALTTADVALNTILKKTRDSGSAVIPFGTSAERDSSAELGYFRFNATTDAFEGYSSGGWGPIVGEQGAQGPQGAQGAEGPQGPAGQDGSQGPTGPQGIQGESGTATIIVGNFGTSKVPSDLPTNGLIPADWDGTGNPAANYQMVIGQSLHYFGAPGVGYTSGDIFNFVGTGQDPTGWINLGNFQGPPGAQGPTGATGAQGPAGAPGSQGPIGATGPQGIQGVQGPQGVAGPIGMNWTGTFNAGTSYLKNDAFEYQGTSYIALVNVSGVTPPAAQFGIVAARGATGPTGGQGPMGPQGPQGVQGPAGATPPLGSALPLMDGTAIAGTATNASREDHVHPTDTTRVARTSATGAALIPSGTTAQRDTSALGAFRYNSQTNNFEGLSNVGWGQVGGGQMFGTAAVKGIFYNAQIIAENVTVEAGTNGLSAGPITVADGFAVTVADGTTWSII